MLYESPPDVLLVTGACDRPCNGTCAAGTCMTTEPADGGGPTLVDGGPASDGGLTSDPFAPCTGPRMSQTQAVKYVAAGSPSGPIGTVRVFGRKKVNGQWVAQPTLFNGASPIPGGGSATMTGPKEVPPITDSGTQALPFNLRLPLHTGSGDPLISCNMSGPVTLGDVCAGPLQLTVGGEMIISWYAETTETCVAIRVSSAAGNTQAVIRADLSPP